MFKFLVSRNINAITKYVNENQKIIGYDNIKIKNKKFDCITTEFNKIDLKNLYENSNEKIIYKKYLDIMEYVTSIFYLYQNGIL